MLPATLFGGHHFLSLSRYLPDGLGTTLTASMYCLIGSAKLNAMFDSAHFDMSELSLAYHDLKI